MSAAPDPNQTTDLPLGPADGPTTLTVEGGSAAADTPPPGDGAADDLPAVPGYRVRAEIARGGMGRVLAAVDLALDREVALKVLLPGADPGRFARESRITARLPHPGVPPVYATGTLADGSPFLAMKLVAGRTLAEEIRAADRPRLLLAFAQVCQAVGFAHSRGVVHRDLKPANVMVGAFGEVQVMDWGIAKDLAGRDEAAPLPPGRPPAPAGADADAGRTTDHDPAGESTDDRTRAGAVLGTPAYLAPEQARGEPADARADVFALGGILCAILTGRPPFAGPQAADVIRRAAAADLADAHARLDACGADPELVALCRGCLSPRPADRPADGRAVADGLTGYLNGVQDRLRAAERERAAAGAREAEQRKRRRVQVTLGAAVLLVLAAGVAAASVLAAWALREKGRAEFQAGAAGEAKALAQGKEADARREAEAARWQARLANDARHAIQVDLGLRARDERDYDRVAALLREVRPEYRGAWETCYVRTLYLRETPVRAVLRGDPVDVVQAAFGPDGRRVLTWGLDGTARVWDAATGREAAVLKGHTAEVYSAAFSPDGRRVLTGSGDSTARVWDAATGRATAVLKGHAGAVYIVGFSPDGTRAITGSGDSTARVWDVGTGRETVTLKGHTGGLECAAFSPDGKFAVTGSGDRTARVWDAETGRELAVLKGHTDEVRTAAFSPDGRRVLTGSADHTARVWDAATGRELAALKGHTWDLRSAAFSPDGKRVATASPDQTARVWDAATGRETAALLGHTGWVNWVVFSPDGRHVVTASDDGTARVWDAATGREAAALKGHTSGVVTAAFSPDGKRVVTGARDGTARVWDADPVPNRAALAGHAGGVGCMAISPDGRRALTGSRDWTARVWDAETGRETAVLKGHTGIVGTVLFSPDGRRALTCGADRGDFTARVWDPETGQETAVLKGHTDYVSGLAFSPDGRQILTTSRDGGQVWDAKTGKVKLRLRGHPGGASGAAFSPDGRRIVTWGEDGTARVWDPETGQETAVLKGHTNTVLTAAFSPDGRRIVTGGEDGTARVWDPETGAETAVFRGKDALIGVAFSPDGKRVVARGVQIALVWDPETGRETAVLKGHAHEVLTAAFSSDGRRVLTGSKDQTARVWDAETGQEKAVLKGHTGWVTAAAFGRDGRRIVTGSMDGTARVWDAETGWVAWLKERFPAVLRGEDGPADAAEGVAFARIAHERKGYALAARLWAEALERDPGLRDDRRSQHRFHAARAAARAAGSGEPPPDEAERARLRGQARDWLRAELGAWDAFLESDPPHARPAAFEALGRWPADADLAGVRDPAALAALPADERAASARLWADVAGVRKRAEPPQAHAYRGDWDAAAGAYARAVSGRPIRDGHLGFEYAAVLLLSGDRAGYRKVCAELLDRGGPAGLRPYLVARACTLAPDSVRDPAGPGRAAADELGKNGKEFWALTQRGALAHRAGRFDEAAALLEQSLKADGRPGSAVLNWLWLSLVEQRRGKGPEARAWLAKATQWLDQFPTGITEREEAAQALHLHNWLEAQVLRREAAAGFAGPAPARP